MPAGKRRWISFAIHVGRGFERTLRQTRAKETRDLLDEGLRGQESVVLLGELLNKLLVLVKPGDFRSASVI